MKRDDRPISRRNLLQFGAGIIGAGSLSAWVGSNVMANTIRSQSVLSGQSQLLAAKPTPTTLTPDEALEKLMQGNQRYVQNKQQDPNQTVARIKAVAEGQAPFAAILGCADSRVVPEIAFDQGIGDLFVVRVAGNLATTEDIASEEFAVGVLGAKLLMVLGHQSCGAVEAAIEGGELPGVIESLVYAIRPAVEASEGQPGDRLTNAVKENVRLQVQRLKTSSVISQAEQEGKLKVVGAYYELDTGEVSLLT